MTEKTNLVDAYNAKFGEPAKRVILPKSGKSVLIFEGLAEDVEAAGRQADGNEKAYLRILMANLCLFDGEKLTPEDIAQIKAKDYHTLLSDFKEVNF